MSTPDTEREGLVERLRLIAAWRKPGGAEPHAKMPSTYKAATEAADMIEAQAAAIAAYKASAPSAALEAEVTRLRGLLIDPGDPAWEDARAVLATELQKADHREEAACVLDAQPCMVPSWITLNLIAQAARTPSAALVEAMLAAFNGGLVNIPDAAFPKGYRVMYDPHTAMAAALASSRGDA